MLLRYKYIYIKSIFFVFFVIISNVGFSQNVSIPDSIIVTNSSSIGLVFNYRVEAGNTMYSISRMFRADLIDLYAFNEGLNKKPLSIGQQIIVPFNLELLEKYNENVKLSKLNVYYKVGKKENLFRIAKIYFGLDVTTIVKLNDLKDKTIQPNQLLRIGKAQFGNVIINKMPKDDVKQIIIEKIEDKEKIIEPKKEIIVKDSIVEKEKIKFDKIVVEIQDSNNKIDSIIVKESPEIVISDRGKALWIKNSRTKGLFVLHNGAKINSLMEIVNPVVNRTITAKVLGPIPTNSYPSDVKIILSSQAAYSLGALDTGFFVKIKIVKK